MKNKKQWVPVLLVTILAICCCVAFFLIGKNGKLTSVVKKDKTAPVITLEGDKNLKMEVGETLHLPKVSATDDKDGDVTKNMKMTLAHGTKLAELADDHFTTEVGGTYQVVYSVCDAAGNEALETLKIQVSAKTPEEDMKGTNDLSVLEDSGSLFYENFEKGPENELLYDNYADYYTLTGMENAISGNSLVVDYGEVTTTNRVTLLSMLPYVTSGTWEISFDVKLVSGEGRDDFYIMYTPNVDENVHYAHRMLLGDMKVGEVRHITYEKVIEVLEDQEGTASFFLCNSNNICGDMVLMFDNFSMRRTDLEYETYIPTVEELEKGFTYDWSDEKYATLAKPVEVAEIKDAKIREALKGSDGFGDRVMLLTDDSVLNGILAANNPEFYQVGREYEIEINYYAVECQGSSLLAVSSVTQGRGIRDNLLPKRNEVDTVTLRYQIGRGEEELSFYLFGYQSEVYIGDVSFKLVDRTDKERNDYHTLTEKELYAGYTFDLSKNNLPKLSGQALFIGNYSANKVGPNLPSGYFKSGETVWVNGLYDVNLDFLTGHLKKDRTYDITLRFYSDLPLKMEQMFLLTKDKDGKATERNLLGMTDLGNGMYELHTQFRTDGTEETVVLYSKTMLSMYLDSITVSMQDAKPIAKIDKGITKNYKIDFDKEWLTFTVRNSRAGYVNEIPEVGGSGLHVKLRERLHFTQLKDFTKDKIYTITLTAQHTGDFGQIVGMFEDENRNPTGLYVTPIKTVSGDVVKYQFTFAGSEKTKMFALINGTPEQEEEMYITDVEILVQDADTTSMKELTSAKGYVSDFDHEMPALGNGQWTTDLPKKYTSSQENFYYVNLKESIDCAMDLSVFDGLAKKGYYYTLTLTGFLNDGGADVYLLPMDENGNYAQYKAKQTTLADGQTQLTYYFNGGDYATGRVCDYLRLFSVSGTEVDYELYLSQISLQAETYANIKGTFDPNMNKIIFPNINKVDDFGGNAQSTIIVNNGKVALIDSGDKSSETSKFILLKKLKELGVTKLDVVIMTHPHSDHYGAFSMLTEYFDVGAYYCKDTCWEAYEINGYGEGMALGFDEVFNSMKAKTNSDGSKVKIDTDVDFGQTVAFGDNGEFVFYYSQEVFGEGLANGEERVKWDGNYFSLGVRYNTKEGYDAYFAGDSCTPTNEELLFVPGFENCEIWQINHHGSSGPYTDMRLITLLDPEYAVVCGMRENLKDDVKSKIESYGGIEICYGGDGDFEFDLNSKKTEIEYKSLSEDELYVGHTYDLSDENMPRLTSSYVDVTYMSDDNIDTDLPDGYFVNEMAIKADGQYMINLEFLNGLIQDGRTYDIKLRAYAPNGFSKSATYIEALNAAKKPLVYHKFGYTSLGDDMYELHCQIRCGEGEKLFTLYSQNPQVFYIESITVSMLDSKEYIVLDEGITQNYSIDFDEKWLDVAVLNTNAVYVKEVPEVGGYGLYTKLNETLFFKQLKGFTEGRTYQITFTTQHTGNYGQLWGIFYDSSYKQVSSYYEPVKMVSGDKVTYIFTFAADGKTQMFGLFNNNRNKEEEFYIQSVDIESYTLDTVTSEEIHDTGYVSDFSKNRMEFGGSRNQYWETDGEVPVLHVKQVAGNTTSLRFDSFKGLFQEGKMYKLKLDVNQISAGTLVLLPLNENNAQINGMTYAVSRSSSAATGKMTYTVTFVAPTGLTGLNLYCTNGTNEMQVHCVTLQGFGMVSEDVIHSTGYVSNFAEEKLCFEGSAVSSYEVQNEETVLHVKQVSGKTTSLRFESFKGALREGYIYQLKLDVNQISNGTLVLLPLNASNAQINGLQYNVTKSSSAATGEMTYTVTFTAPAGIKNLNLYCTGGTNEMQVRHVTLQGFRMVSEDVLHNTGYVSDFADEKLNFGGNAASSYEVKDEETVLHVKQVGGQTPSLRFDSFSGAFREGYIYQLKLNVNQTSNGTLVLLPLNANHAQINGLQYNVTKSSSAATGEMTYTVTFTAPAGIKNINLYCISGTNEMQVKSFSLNGYATVKGTMINNAYYVSDFANEKLYLSATDGTYKVQDNKTVYYVKQKYGVSESFKLDSFDGAFKAGYTYYLRLKVNQISKGTIILMPLNANNAQIVIGGRGQVYDVVRSSSDATGEMTYTVKFTAPEGIKGVKFYCTGGTNEMEVEQIELQGISTSTLSTTGITVTPDSPAFVYSGGKEVNFVEEAGKTLLNLTIGDTYRSFNFDTYTGLMTAGKTYRLTIRATEDNNPTVGNVLLLPRSTTAQLSQHSCTRVVGSDGVTYTFTFTAKTGIHQLRFYYNSASLFTTKIQSVTLQEVQ